MDAKATRRSELIFLELFNHILDMEATRFAATIRLWLLKNPIWEDLDPGELRFDVLLEHPLVKTAMDNHLITAIAACEYVAASAYTSPIKPEEPSDDPQA